MLLVHLERGPSVELVDDVLLGASDGHLAGGRLEAMPDADAPGRRAEYVQGGGDVGRRSLRISDQRGLEAALVASRAADDLVERLGLREDLPHQLFTDAGQPVGEHHGRREGEALGVGPALRRAEVPAQLGGGALRVLLQAGRGGALGNALRGDHEEHRDCAVGEAAFGHLARRRATDDLLRARRGARRAQRVAQGQVR